MTGFETIEDLVRAVDLVDIRIWEDSVRVTPRTEATSDGEDAEEAPDLSPELHFKAASWNDETVMRFRFKLSFHHDRADYVSDIESVYEVPAGELTVSDTSEEILQDFAERVAFMATYPHIRAAVYGSAGRLGQTRPLLPLIRPGEMRASEELSPEDINAEFGIPAAQSGNA